MKLYVSWGLVTALTILNSLTSFALDSSVRAVSDVQSMVLRADGKYDVVCKNGSTEVVTSEQIKENNVCGGGCLPHPGPEIEAIFSRSQGEFFVLCKSFSWEVATIKSIQEGNVCLNPNSLVGEWATFYNKSCNGNWFSTEHLKLKPDFTCMNGNRKCTWHRNSNTFKLEWQNPPTEKKIIGSVINDRLIEGKAVRIDSVGNEIIYYCWKATR